jgi:2-phospho-L-lactate transferase/gluconeogenesis factor (CofD/UPF0052 family)
MPTLLVEGVADALEHVRGPIIVVSNLLTEGRGMRGFTAAGEAGWVSDAIGRPVDVIIGKSGVPTHEALVRYESEHKHPLSVGDPPTGTELVLGEFWRTEIARHDRRRLSYAVWSVLSRRVLK